MNETLDKKDWRIILAILFFIVIVPVVLAITVSDHRKPTSDHTVADSLEYAEIDSTDLEFYRQIYASRHQACTELVAQGLDGVGESCYQRLDHSPLGKIALYSLP